jgi:type VI secretion system secreted protein VgrG
MGHEVVVQYLGGDPDRPIITGSVYNQDNPPPYPPDKTPTQSGIKTRSTLGATPNNFNEIRFEDKKGEEELYFQAEKNQTTKVKHNQSISVGADRSVSVGGNESISVDKTRTTHVKKKETQTFDDDRVMTVTKTNKDEVTDLHTGLYHKGRTETVENADDHLEVLGADKIVHVAKAYKITADQEYLVQQGANKINIKNPKIVIDESGQCTITLDGGKLSLNAASEIAITCGAASISLKADGTIEMTGKTVKSGNANNNVVCDPSGTTVNGVKITSAATGMHEIQGALIKIG